MEMFPGSLTLAAASTKGLALIIGNYLQTGVLITLGTGLMLVGRLLHYKFQSKQEDRSTTPDTFWAKPTQSTASMSSATGGAAHGTSFNLATTLQRQSDRRPIGYLAIQSTPTTDRRPNLV